MSRRNSGYFVSHPVIYIIDTFHTTCFSLIPATNSVVGYQGQAANATRNTMMAPTFLNVGSETGCTLADLTVTGYTAPQWNEDDEEYTDGCFAGEFVLQFLANNGSITDKYYWIDDGETGPAWCDRTGEPIDAATVAIPAGTAAWVIGSGKTLQSAGQVSAKDFAVKMNATRNTACGNAMPTDLTLADLSVSGYTAPQWNEDDEEYTDGCFAGEFVLQFLANNGSITDKYYWIDDGETGPAWCDRTGEPIDASKVSVPAGKGMWVIGSGKVLNIPSPIAD